MSDSATVDQRSGSGAGAPATKPPAPRRIGRYTVLSTLGAGAMGEVLRARDDRLGRDVAIKTVRNVLGLSAESFHQRFEAEARALAALSHPGIVQVHDLGFEPSPDGEPYLVMELVDGESLKGRLEKGRLGPAEARALGVQLARALEAAHRRGILHRDIKPANILCTSTGQWKLADFGVAHVPDSSMTITGQFLGTPAYAAPEALALGQFSEQSDVFGLAMTLVEALSGEKLRGNATLSEMVRRSADALELPPSVPPDLAAALRPALAFDAARRPNAAQLAEALAGAPVDTLPPGARISMATPVPAPLPHHTLTGATRPRKPLWIAGAALGAVLLIGLVAALSRGDGGGDAVKASVPPPATKATGAPATTTSARPAPTPVDEPPVADDEPVEEPGPPRHKIDKNYGKELKKVADKANEGKFGEALDKLDKVEDKYGRTVDTVNLRRQIDQVMKQYGVREVDDDE